ncbi:MAG TPA: hypothetical protein VGM54_08395 [Chthoniobacter sp.]|jgi:hypothetical protein
MNDAEFEKNLRQLLRPAEPSADLEARIRHDLLAPDIQPEKPAAVPFAAASLPALLLRLLRDFGWACAGGAAVLVVLALVHGWPRPGSEPMTATAAATNPAPAEAAQPAAFEHDETTHDLVSTEGSDEVIETDEGPAREVRYSYVERHAWSNPQTGARVVLEVPREDVYLVPVSLQ